MSVLAEKAAKILRAYKDAQSLVLRRRNRASRFSRLVVGRPNWKRVILHTAVAFALFAGYWFWMVAHYTGAQEVPSAYPPGAYLVALGGFVTPVGYLFAVWVLTKGK